MTDRVVVRQAATSGGAVLGGWVATIGASVIFAPLVAGMVAAFGSQYANTDIVAAVPFVLGILLSYLVGGYVAGRMAGYRTSWHGMMTAFFSLFILLIVLLVGGLAGTGALSGTGISSLGDLIPGTRDLNIDSFGNALSFGAILGFLAAIFGGWLGGLLAPSHVVMAAPVASQPRSPVTMHTPVSMREERRLNEGPRRTVIPAYGRKGGEQVDERVEKREERVEKRTVDEVHRPTSDS